MIANPSPFIRETFPYYNLALNIKDPNLVLFYLVFSKIMTQLSPLSD